MLQLAIPNVYRKKLTYSPQVSPGEHEINSNTLISSENTSPLLDPFSELSRYGDLVARCSRTAQDIDSNRHDIDRELYTNGTSSFRNFTRTPSTLLFRSASFSDVFNVHKCVSLNGLKRPYVCALISFNRFFLYLSCKLITLSACMTMYFF